MKNFKCGLRSVHINFHFENCIACPRWVMPTFFLQEQTQRNNPGQCCQVTWKPAVTSARSSCSQESGRADEESLSPPAPSVPSFLGYRSFVIFAQGQSLAERLQSQADWTSQQKFFTLLIPRRKVTTLQDKIID